MEHDKNSFQSFYCRDIFLKDTKYYFLSHTDSIIIKDFIY